MKNDEIQFNMEEWEGIEKFWEEVERRAEIRMMKTGKLEGAHYLSARTLLREIREKFENEEFV